MIVPYIFFLVCICAYPAQIQTMYTTTPVPDSDSEYSWPNFVKNYSEYYKDLKETDAERKLIFENNVKKIKQWNKETDQGIHSYYQGINFFAAMTDEEKKLFHGSVITPFASDDDEEPDNIENHLGQGYERLEDLYKVYQTIENDENQLDGKQFDELDSDSEYSDSRSEYSDSRSEYPDSRSEDSEDSEESYEDWKAADLETYWDLKNRFGPLSDKKGSKDWIKLGLVEEVISESKGVFSEEDSEELIKLGQVISESKEVISETSKDRQVISGSEGGEQNSGSNKTKPLADRFDWREHGVVSHIKHQGRCAGCYAFSAVDAIESNYAIASGKLLLLSPQMVIDCTEEYGNDGCRGGWIGKSYEWMKKNGGVALEADYPFTKKKGVCKKYVTRALNVTDYLHLTKDDQVLLKAAVQLIGPVAVTINGKLDSFGLYRGGIYMDPECDENYSHSGLLVGFGDENGVPYWIVKNSWGPRWGENGYIRIKRDGRNLCGVASKTYIPLFKSHPESLTRPGATNNSPDAMHSSTVQPLN